MNDEESRLEPAFQELERHAVQERVDIDPSFFTELKNYSRHDIVRDLSHPELHRVMVGLGRMAIGRSGERVGAGAVRLVIAELCPRPFSACDLAASYILRGTKEGYSVGAPELPDNPFTGAK